MNKGFTLVELSIVLVVIGLLIGGILVGQSLIASSRINAQVQQISQFDIATSTFVSKFKAIPGDYSKLGCNTSNCDDRIINDWFSIGFGSYPSSTFRVWAFDWELANFWTQLAVLGSLEKGVTYTSTLSASGFRVSSNTRNSPQAKLNPKAGIVVGSMRMQPPWKSYTMYQIADYSAVSSSNNNLGAAQTVLTPIEALAIDQKIDDGSPEGTGTGAVFPADAVSYWGAPDTTSCASGGAYKTTDTISCKLAIQVMHSTGGIPIKRTDY